MSEQPGRYQRSFSGLVGAMVVLLLVIGAFVLFRDANRKDPVKPVEAVDYERPAEFAQDTARFPVLAPEPPPTGWVATSVRFTDGEEQAWHLGFLTPSRRYVGLEQAERPLSAMVADHVDEEAAEGDRVEVGGSSWTEYTDADGDLALAREEQGVTTLVVGTVPRDVLDDFVTTLR